MFRRRKQENTIGTRIAAMLADPTGWTCNPQTRQYRLASCPFMVMKSYHWDGDSASVWDDDTPGRQVPIDGREAKAILRGLARIDAYIRSSERAAALQKFVEKCGA